MSTTIYLPSSGTAPVTPSTWNFPYQAGTTYTLPGVTSKTSTSIISRTTATGTVSPRLTGVMRYVIGPLAEVQISGTVNMPMMGSESNAGANATLAVAVKIIQPNGADRSVLLAAVASDLIDNATYEYGTSLGQRRAWDASETRPVPLTAQTPTSGDYLVIEIGFRSATTVSRNIVLQHGDGSGSNLPDADSGTNQYDPWITFSQTLSFIVDHPMNAEPSSYSLSGQAATPLADRLIPALSSSYGLTGTVLTSLRGLLLNANPGNYSLAGQDTTLLRGLLVNAESGTYTVTGFDATLLYVPAGTTMNAEPGTYVVTGDQATLLTDRLLSADSAVFVITGSNVSALVDRILSADPSAYVVSGQDAIVLADRLLSADPSAYALSGLSAELVYTPISGTYNLNAEPGVYVIVGSPTRADLDLLTFLSHFFVASSKKIEM